MKLLIFIIVALLISHRASAQDGTYTDVPSSEYENDEDILGLLNYGADYVVQQGIQYGRLPDSDFEVTQIFRVQRQEVPGGVDYRFDVELSNGEMTIRADYDVSSGEDSENPDITSSSFDITSASNEIEESTTTTDTEVLIEEESVVGEWNFVNVSDLNTDDYLRGILNFGADNVISYGVEDGALLGTNYYIEDVIRIENQTAGGTNYRFGISLGNVEGEEISASFVVYDEPWSNIREVDYYEFFSPNDGDSSFGNEEQALSDEGWDYVDVNEVDTNSDLEEILDFGTQYVILKGIESGQLFSPDFEPLTIYSIKEQTLDDGDNYRFNVQFEDEAGSYTTIIFRVFDQSWNNTREVTSYLFLDIDNVEDNQEEETEPPGEWFPINVDQINIDQFLWDILEFGIQYVVTEEVQTGRFRDSYYYENQIHSIQGQVANGVNYQFDIDLVGQEGDFARVTFIVYDIPWENSREVTSYSFVDTEEDGQGGENEEEVEDDGPNGTSGAGESGTSGEPGETGGLGTPGAVGSSGENGEPGETGSGENGEPGETGESGTPGAVGSSGENGEPGEPVEEEEEVPVEEEEEEEAPVEEEPEEPEAPVEESVPERPSGSGSGSGSGRGNNGRIRNRNGGGGGGGGGRNGGGGGGGGG